MPIFTTDDLLLYLYGELDAAKTLEIMEALKKDWALQQKLQVLHESMDTLDTTSFEAPRSQTTENLLHYAELTQHIVQ
jgi:hypothetical protein